MTNFITITANAKKFYQNFLPKGNRNVVKWMTNFITITANAKKFHPSSCQKEIGMLSSEWQTLSLSQPMQKRFIQVLAQILPNNQILTTYAFVGNFDWQMILSSKHRFCQTLHSYISVVITTWNPALKVHQQHYFINALT